MKQVGDIVIASIELVPDVVERPRPDVACGKRSFARSGRPGYPYTAALQRVVEQLEQALAPSSTL